MKSMLIVLTAQGGKPVLGCIGVMLSNVLVV
jgi:hypothetical protein